MQKRIKIGIVGWSVGDNSFGATKPYLAHLNYYGDPVILCPQQGIVEDIAMVVLPGGADMSSSLYGQAPGFWTGSADQCKEYFIKQNLAQYIERGVPIWGTCLGFQQLNVYFGGTMDQHINTNSHGYSFKSRDELAHPLEFAKEWKKLEKQLLAKTSMKFKKDETPAIWTNSLHHQGVPIDGVNEEAFSIIASAGDYVEAFIHRTLPIAGAQFHTEEDYNDLGVYMFEQMVEKAIEYDRNGKAVKEEPVGEVADLH